MMNTSTSEPDRDDLAAMISASAYIALVSDQALLNDLLSSPDHRLAAILLLTRRGMDAGTIMATLGMRPGDIAMRWQEWVPR